MEPPARPALAHHVHRAARLGSCMISNAGWYYMSKRAWAEYLSKDLRNKVG
jgi:hypothetical protein